MTTARPWIFPFLCLFVASGSPCDAKRNVTPRKNVLLIMVDDLRAEIGSFLNSEKRPWLNPHIKTPNMDALASSSMVLRQAYVQQALCNPSRTSILTGRRPDTTNVTDNFAWFRETGNADIITLPQYFRRNGYTTIGIGKVYHLLSNYDQDFDLSWSKFFGFRSEIGDHDEPNAWRTYTNKEIEDKPLMDQLVTVDAKALLTNQSSIYKQTGEPFFMAVGYRRPHMPWVFPERFLSYYPLDDIALPLNPFVPADMPEEAWSHSIELTHHMPNSSIQGWPVNTTVSNGFTRHLRRAYYGCVSYIDHEIGLLMEHLKSLGLYENTVIGFLGDHGWQLGEHAIWGKETNFEEDTHAPLMVRIPGKTDGGLNREEQVEFVDLYPTLVEAAGLPTPPLCPVDNPNEPDLCVDGVSMMPLLSPKRTDWKKAVFSQYPSLTTDAHQNPLSMGYSVRTVDYRYTEWWGKEYTESGRPDAAQLFDMKSDPLERYNVVGHAEYQSAIDELSEMLRNGWRSFIPT